MKFSLFSAVALPGALAVPFSMLAHRPSSDVVRRADGDADCVLPRDYRVQEFAARTNDTGTTLSSLHFTFADTATNVTTLCQYNSSSTSTTPPGLTPRYSCENRDVKFIWEDEDSQLWLIERVCPNPDGTPTYEASGSMLLNLSCSGNGTCSSNSTSQTALFTSLQPVRDPTKVRSLE
ncbi:hypothetical protein B0I35DRAFT_405725 [Stachybotrys elegans]|uniref:AA1-like domain-containing protein n=1 Tax=Stachybotrys elegans TaxID=80388 RepID=A0A8K0WVA7_9HYPO|nr:hypothetical protein B0I35DRAFT_405725 [Stachybotrys elegans]